MGLFGEEDEETAGEADPSAPEDEPEPDPSDQADEEAEAVSEAPDEEPDAEEAEASDGDAATDDAGADQGAEESASSGDGEDIDVEEALKDLSARMSVLSSNLEGVQEERDELEDKIGDVEERMSRLGSLAEAVSSEYNPFVSENAPDQPSWTPEHGGPEAGEDPAPGPSPDLEDPAEQPDEPPMAPEPGEGGEDPTSQPDPEPEAGGDPIPRTNPESLQPEEPQRPEPQQGTDPLGRESPSREPHQPGQREAGELEENLILLEWVGMMLDRVGRAGLMDLLDYYQNLGWLDPETKDQATRVAVGVDAPDRVGDGHWRGDVELHRRSLVAIQRLQGDEIPAARLDELELDLRRLFRE